MQPHNRILTVTYRFSAPLMWLGSEKRSKGFLSKRCFILGGKSLLLFLYGYSGLYSEATEVKEAVFRHYNGCFRPDI